MNEDLSRDALIKAINMVGDELIETHNRLPNSA